MVGVFFQVLSASTLLATVYGDVILDPPLGVENGDLVVENNMDFTLVCRGEDDVNVSWSFPEYEPEEKEVVEREEYGQHISTLTVRNAIYVNTGFYICHPKGEGADSPQAKKIYVYVKDPENTLALNETFRILTFHQYQTVVIPCRPTDPSLEVELVKDDDEECKHTYNPHVGFTLDTDLDELIHQQAPYYCKVREKGSDDVINEYTFILHIIMKTKTEQVEAPHIDVSPSPVVEGMNVTLVCAVHYEIGVTVDLVWSVPNANLFRTGHLAQNETGAVREPGNTKQTKGVKKLTIYDVTKHDEGDYRCDVHDNSGNNNTNKFHLTVLRSQTSTLELTLRGHKTTVITVDPSVPETFLVVDVISYPVPKSIQWYIGGKNNPEDLKPIIGESSSHYEVKNTNVSSKLTIHHPKVVSSGFYVLKVDNGNYKKSINVTLQVKGLPAVTVNDGVSLRYYQVGRQHTIGCEVQSFPEINKISWTFTPCPEYPQCRTADTMPVPTYEELEINTYQGLYRSEIRWANLTGELKCEGQNKLGSNSATTTFLATDVENGFAIKGPKLVVESDNFTLSCGVSKYNYTKDKLDWLYSPEPSNPSAVLGLTTWTDESNYSYFVNLDVPSANKNLTGYYVCSAEHKFKRRNAPSIQKLYRMDVKSLKEPVINRNITNEFSVKTGHTVRLDCNILSGMPFPDISWYKDDVNVLQREWKEISNNETLEVQVGLDDDGSYTCVAQNKAGKDQIKFKINVTDKFKAPWYLLYVLGIIAVLIILVFAVIGQRYYRMKRQIKDLKAAGLHNFEEGNVAGINPEIDIGEQADLLPYDKGRWEFDRNKLKLGKELGRGAFGVVLKAEAYELEEEGVATTVAVKMVKRNSDVQTIRALASELKIMVHLGKHLNVVNVLGACTGDLNKRELLVLVEYCRYGNLHKYLFDRRGAFINQVNAKTSTFDPTLIQPTTPFAPSGKFFESTVSNGYNSAGVSAVTATTMIASDMSEHSNGQTGANDYVSTPLDEDGYLVSRDHKWRRSQGPGQQDYKEPGLRPVCTQDLICWAFEIARGMEYLASRKVLHGDLAARNVLLADDNIVKICDFGFSKSMYTDANYQKKGDDPLPVKWMALESIRDRVFSTQSDVWAYGITLWELFSLACTPYPGVQVDEGFFRKLESGYRMEQPKYGTKQVYQVMLDCWHVNPHSRPSFTELTERLGGMLEDTVRTHYVDLNDPFLQENTEFLAQQDYLSMLRTPPTYVNFTPGYSVMRPVDPEQANRRGSDPEAMELTPMLNNNAAPTTSTSSSPEGSPPVTTKPIDETSSEATPKLQGTTT